MLERLEPVKYHPFCRKKKSLDTRINWFSDFSWQTNQGFFSAHLRQYQPHLFLHSSMLEIIFLSSEVKPLNCEQTRTYLSSCPMWQLGRSGGQWVTHREWVASVCLGDFTLFRQALQECPTIRPIGSCSTDLLGRHWLIWRPAVWKHCLCNLLSLCSCLQLSPAVCLATARPLWLIPDVHSTVTIKTTLG